ncbi:helical backbone metal receptor [Fictibacillus phosphorivorans]|uniref:helical backbone metal receptor n=1 Tax=Fictibacillus phosphorivorans TaxID=1221500 RepID=UPI00203EAF5D|nr:helical backbone metal receptor [Fictibacillus phosphorivorans]MCM3718753.1 helical backbone metal receptor [Fictibacillus phosphorivorans]MCM3776376.1 helical backbone metal receptor [Fictibacillus phosphorivorans]
MKLVSICPSNTELLHFLGAASDLIGVDDFSDWPSDVEQLPRLGPDLSIDMNKLEALEPDLVLASLSVPGMEKNIEELKMRNIPHVIYDPQSLADIQNDLLDLGKRVNKMDSALQAVKWMKNEIEEYKKISETLRHRKRIYFEWWPKPVFTPGKINWLTEVSRLAGGLNIFEDVELASVQTTWKDVVERKPDLIGMVWVGVKTDKMNPSHIKKRDGWEVLHTFGTEIEKLEESLFCRPSPRLIFGLKRLAALIHPQDYPAFLPDDEERYMKELQVIMR